jgi:excisionase family DNA binding protein
MLGKASPPSLKDYLTVAEAAEFLGVTPTTLRRWDRKGKLRSKRHPINRYRLYRKKDLQVFLTKLNT